MQSEADRRQNLIDDLLTREKQLNATFKGDATEPEPSRYSFGNCIVPPLVSMTRAALNY